MHHLRRLLLILGLIAALPAFAQTLLIAAGAGYKKPLAEICAGFEKTSGIKVEQVYGNMGNVVAQARQSGDIAVIFGDQRYLDKVKDLAFARYLPLGNGRLVVAWPTGGKLTTPAGLADPRFARIAMPNPGAAIYGIAASEFMKSAGLAEALKERLQIVATVPQVSAYLITGDVDAGFINLTEALALKDKIGGYLEIDPASYAPIHIVGAVLPAHAEDPALAALNDYLNGSEARTILARYGL